VNPCDPYTVERVKAAVRIESVVSEFVQLRRYNRHNLMGLCPFHQERTASFNVNLQRQIFKCFGCGAGGDVLRFVQQIEGISFGKALASLAERAGISVSKVTRAEVVAARAQRKLQQQFAAESVLYWAQAVRDTYSWVMMCGQMFEFICEWLQSEEFTEDLADEMHELADLCLLVGRNAAKSLLDLPLSGGGGYEPFVSAYSQLPRSVRSYWSARVMPEPPGELDSLNRLLLRSSTGEYCSRLVLGRGDSSPRWMRTVTSTMLLIDAAERREAEKQIWMA
jgi:hypothetical protein